MQYQLGKLNLARQNAQQALRLSTQLGMREPAYDVRGYLADIAAAGGNFQEAHQQLRERQILQDSLYQAS